MKGSALYYMLLVWLLSLSKRNRGETFKTERRGGTYATSFVRAHPKKAAILSLLGVFIAAYVVSKKYFYALKSKEARAVSKLSSVDTHKPAQDWVYDLIYYLFLGRGLANLVDKRIASHSSDTQIIAAIKKIDCVKIKSKKDDIPLEWEKYDEATDGMLKSCLNHIGGKIGVRDTSYKAYVEALKQITDMSDDQGLTWRPVDWQAIEEAVKL